MVRFVFYCLFLKLVTELAIFIVEGILFYSSTPLIEKKFFLTSSRAACCLKFSGHVALLVVCWLNRENNEEVSKTFFEVSVASPKIIAHQLNLLSASDLILIQIRTKKGKN
jgi:hypothetical protein